MKYFVLLILAVLLILPVSVATPSIPDVQMYEYGGDGKIIMYNTHSNETVEISYKNHEKYIKNGVDDLNYILRCRLTGERTPIDMKLIELIDYIQDHFGGDEVQIISGYRSPELNGVLSSRSRGVGKRSYHMKGMAMDIRIPGVSTRAIRDFARSLKQGGVGYYPGPDFVHIDVGPVRYW